MSVSVRGGKFHFRFQSGGKGYSGVCPGCVISPGASKKEVAAIEKKALAFEVEEKNRVQNLIHEQQLIEEDVRKNKTVRALVENYRFELTGGSPVPISGALALAEAKPSRKAPSNRYFAQRRSYWNDFAAFMGATYPDVETLTAVRKTHCEAYISYLCAHGRFDTQVEYLLERKRRRTKRVAYSRGQALSPKTIKEMAGTCKWVFNRLAEDAGIVIDPWKGVQLPEPAPVDREVFSVAELRMIWEGIQNNPFCYVLFFVAANSGMTEGDICTLKWEEVDWVSNYIRRKRRKTGAEIRLPMVPELAEYLRSLPRGDEYIFPEHAQLYLRNSQMVSVRVKEFLHGLGIVTTVEIPGRRAVSVKDLHSMRHVFCYRAKRAGIPESIIAKFVGHKVVAMTQHYADHDSDEELASEIKKLPPLFHEGAGAAESREATLRQKLAQLAYQLPLAEVERLLSNLALPEPQPGATPLLTLCS